jgi:hypothetical protein
VYPPLRYRLDPEKRVEPRKPRFGLFCRGLFFEWDAVSSKPLKTASFQLLGVVFVAPRWYDIKHSEQIRNYKIVGFDLDKSEFVED